MTAQKQYDVPEVLAALEAAVAERGEDYVYQQPVNEFGQRLGCFYVHKRDTGNAHPGCLVGQVYFDLTGHLVPGSWEVGIDTGDEGCEWVSEGPFTPKALEILSQAQWVQDDGKPWGEALAAARKVAEV